ncbi:MAG: hypothetical protein P8016_00575 [Sedimentisphaerales bacterium]
MTNHFNIRNTLSSKSFRTITKASAYKQPLLVLGDQGFRSISTFFTAMLLGRICDQAEYGLYTLLLTLLVAAEAFQMAMICSPYVVQIPSKSTHQKEIYLGNTILVQSFMAVSSLAFGLCILFVFAIHWIRGLPSGMIWGFSAAYLAVLSREFLRQVLLADLKVGWNLLYGATVHLSILAISFWLAITGRLNSTIAFLCIALCSAIPAFIVLFLKRKHIKFDMRNFRVQLSQDWYIGKWLTAQAAIAVVSGPLYGWVLAYSKGTATVGLLGACMLPVSVLSPVVQALNAFLLPKTSHAAQRSISDVRRIVLLSSITVGLGFLVFPIAIAVFSDVIMKAMFAGKYNPSSWLVLFFGLRTYIIMAFVPFSAGLIACKRSYLTFKSEIISLVLTLLVGLPMTYITGVWGVAWGFLLTRLFSRIYMAIAFERHVKASIAEAGTAETVNLPSEIAYIHA